MSKHPVGLASTLVFFLVLGTQLFAATKTSSQSGNWSSSSTWGGASAPSSGDDVIINGSFTVTVDIPSAACRTVQLGGSTLGTGSGTLVFSSGSHLIVSGPVTLGVTNNTPGSVTMTSGGTLTCEGIVLNRLGTWTPGTGTVEFTATNTIPSNNNVDFFNLTISSGSTSLSRNMSVSGNLLINTGAFLLCGANTLTLGGSWTNNGTFEGNTGTVIFNKNGSTSISGGGTNNFNLIKVDLGTSIANTLEVVSAHFAAPDFFLTLTNGTFKMSGSFTFANTFITGPIYNIQPTSGLWINNPNVTVTAQAGGVSVRGLLRLSAGTYNVGTGTDQSLDYVAGSAITIEGGALHIAGRLSRNSPASTTSYTQTGGIVSVVEQGSTDPTFAGFDLGTPGCSFTMSGGTIVIRNATASPADFLNIASARSVTGGTLQFGDTNTRDAQVFRINSTSPVGNLSISHAMAGSTKPDVQLAGSSLTVNGSIVIQSKTRLIANGLNITVGGDWTDDGTFVPAGNTVTFNGTGLQAITSAAGETFSNFSINSPGGPLTLNNPVEVTNTFSLSQGALAIGMNTLTLDGAVSGGGTLTSAANGSVVYNQNGDGQNILAGSYGNLTFNNFNKTLPSSGTIAISGTFSPGTAGSHAIAGSTIDFNGAAQIIPAMTYHNLSLSGSGVKSGSGGITVLGSMTNSSGVIFSDTASLVLGAAAHTNAGVLNAASIVVGSGAALTNNGTITAGSSLSGPGSLTQGSSGILNLGGSAAISALSAAAAGNTVNYTGNSQTAVPVVYHHLIFSGSGSPNLTGITAVNGNFTIAGTAAVAAAEAMVIGGDLSVGAGASFVAGTFAHTVKGNMTNAGLFTAGGGAFTLNGTSAQKLTGLTMNDLVVSNPSGISLASDLTINGTLTLASGGFAVGANTLTLNGALSIGTGSLVTSPASGLVIGGTGPQLTLPSLSLNTLTLARAGGGLLGGDAAISGNLTITNGTLNTMSHAVVLGPTATLAEPSGQPVVGTVRTTRTITAPTGTETFGNIGADITMNGVPLGSTSVVRTTGSVSTGNGHNSIARSYDITPTVNAGLNAGLALHYDSTELHGMNAHALELYRSRDNGVTWNNVGGVVDTVSRRIVAAGLNDLSRWTASDTANRIGLTAPPSIASITPASKSAGDPGFTLTVNGTEFVNGKSIVRLKGSDRATTYVSSTQLTAPISASDCDTVGAFAITVFTADGGGSSNAKSFTVTPGAPASVRIETAADGGGTLVSAKTITAGSAMTVYAITRDSLRNFIANVAADAWTLIDSSGGVVSADLIPSADKKSATFNARLKGSVALKAASGALTSVPSGLITVVPGIPRTLSLTSGNSQFARIGTALADPFVVTITDTAGNPVQGVNVGFAITAAPAGAAGQSLSSATASTDTNGRASTRLSLGTVKGLYSVTAASTGLNGSPIRFAATATQPAALALSVRTIDFGNVAVGHLKDTTLIIANTGSDTLSISSMPTSSPVFTTRRASFSIVADGSQIDTLRFAPTTSGAVSSIMIIASNAQTSPDTVRLIGTGIIITTLADGGNAPHVFSLEQNFPNPFNPSTTISFSVPALSHVTLEIMNLLGQRVGELVNGDLAAGLYRKEWNPPTASGVYLYRIVALALDGSGRRFEMVKKMIMVK